MEYSLENYFINRRIVPFLVREQPITNCSPHKLLKLQDEISAPKEESEKIENPNKLIPSSAKCLYFDCVLPTRNTN